MEYKLKVEGRHKIFLNWRSESINRVWERNALDNLGDLRFLLKYVQSLGTQEGGGADSEFLPPLEWREWGPGESCSCSSGSGWRRGCVLLKDQGFCLSMTLQRRGQGKKCPDVSVLLTPDLLPVLLIGLAYHQGNSVLAIHRNKLPGPQSRMELGKEGIWKGEGIYSAQWRR